MQRSALMVDVAPTAQATLEAAVSDVLCVAVRTDLGKDRGAPG